MISLVKDYLVYKRVFCLAANLREEELSFVISLGNANYGKERKEFTE